jgi:hypothetical protein
MSSNADDPKVAQAASPSPVDQLSCSVSLHTTGSLGVRRGFRLVAGVGLSPADCCRRPRGGAFGRNDGIRDCWPNDKIWRRSKVRKLGAKYLRR